jgi:hypothetical protein
LEQSIIILRLLCTCNEGSEASARACLERLAQSTVASATTAKALLRFVSLHGYAHAPSQSQRGEMTLRGQPHFQSISDEIATNSRRLSRALNDLHRHYAHMLVTARELVDDTLYQRNRSRQKPGVPPLPTVTAGPMDDVADPNSATDIAEASLSLRSPGDSGAAKALHAHQRGRFDAAVASPGKSSPGTKAVRSHDQLLADARRRVEARRKGEPFMLTRQTEIEPDSTPASPAGSARPVRDRSGARHAANCSR